MQLLERKDKQKWFVWTAQGKLQESDMNIDDNELDTSDFQTNIYDFYNRTDAQANFEKRFFDKSANKWVEKDFFKQKPGKFVLLNKEEKKKMMKEAHEIEKELVEVIKSGDVKFECTLESDL